MQRTAVVLERACSAVWEGSRRETVRGLRQHSKGLHDFRRWGTSFWAMRVCGGLGLFGEVKVQGLIAHHSRRLRWNLGGGLSLEVFHLVGQCRTEA